MGLFSFSSVQAQNALTLGNGTAGITIYNTADQATNYERFQVKYVSNILEMHQGFGGSATQRTIRLGCSTAAGGAINTYFTIDPSGTPSFFNFTRSSSLAGPFLGISGINPIGSSGTQIAASINPVILQTGTAAYIALEVNPTESSTGSGTKILQQWAVGGAVRASLNNAGLLTLGNATLLATNVALTNGAGASAGTLANAPAAGNPTKWIPISDNGTTRYIPAW